MLKRFKSKRGAFQRALYQKYMFLGKRYCLPPGGREYNEVLEDFQVLES